MTATRKWIAFTALGAVAIVLLGYFGLVHPKQSHAAELRAQSVDVAEQTSRLKLTLEQLTAESAQMPQYQATLAKFANEIPDQSELPTMIRQLTKIATDSGVDLDTIAPSAMGPYKKSDSDDGTAAGTGLAQIPIEIKVNGGFAPLEEFLSALEDIPRAFVVSEYTLIPDDGADSGDSSVVTSAGALTLSLKTKMFVLPVDGDTGTGSDGTTDTGTSSSATASPSPGSGEAGGSPATSDQPAGGSTASPSPTSASTPTPRDTGSTPTSTAPTAKGAL